MNKRKNYKEYLRKSFIQYAMVLFVSMALLVAGFFVLNYVVTILRQNERSGKEMASLFAAEYDRYTKQSEMLETDDLLREVLLSDDTAARSGLSRTLYDFANAGMIRARFVVLDAAGTVRMSNLTKGNERIFEESLFLKRVLSRTSDSTGTLSLLCDIPFSADQDCAYSFAASVRDDDGAYLGCVFLNMRTDDLETFVSQMKEEVILLDRYDNAVYSSLRLPDDPGGKLPNRYFSQDIGERGIYVINDTRMYVRRTHLSASDIDVITMTSIERQMDMYGMAVVFFILALVVLFVLMLLMTRLYTGINEREVDVLMRDLEIKNLEEQFHPHFVFNVMESVYFQIDEDSEKAKEMLMAFSTLMRYAVDHGRTKVRLETDIDYLNDFLMLQKIRFNNLLSYTFDIPDELLDCMVPKLLLQPVVENSIKHGFVSGQDLHILIGARRNGEDLEFIVSDDGKGIPEEKLTEIRASFAKEAGDGSVQHIGLYNVEKVCKTMYGEQYGLTIESADTGGTRVRILMPYEAEDSDD